MNPLIPIPAKTVTSAYTTQTDDYVINVNGSAPVTITLKLNPSSGESFIVKDISGNAVGNSITVTTSDGSTIDGAASYLIQTNYQSAVFIYDSTTWRVY